MEEIYVKGEVSRVDNDEYGGRQVIMSNYSDLLGNSVEYVTFPPISDLALVSMIP